MKTNNRIKWMISLSFILFIPSTNIAQNAVQAPKRTMLKWLIHA